MHMPVCAHVGAHVRCTCVCTHAGASHEWAGALCAACMHAGARDCLCAMPACVTCVPVCVRADACTHLACTHAHGCMVVPPWHGWARDGSIDCSVRRFWVHHGWGMTGWLRSSIIVPSVTNTMMPITVLQTCSINSGHFFLPASS